MPNFLDLPTEIQLMILDEFYADRLQADPWIVDIKFEQSTSTGSLTEKKMSRGFSCPAPKFDPLFLVNHDLAELARVSFDRAVTGYVGKIRVSFLSEGHDPSAVIEVIDTMSNERLRRVLYQETTGIFLLFTRDGDVEKASQCYKQQQFEERFRSLQKVISNGPLTLNPQIPRIFQVKRLAATTPQASKA